MHLNLRMYPQFAFALAFRDQEIQLKINTYPKIRHSGASHRPEDLPKICGNGGLHRTEDAVKIQGMRRHEPVTKGDRICTVRSSLQVR